MCGGGSSTPDYNYTQQEVNIGLGLKHIIYFRDNVMYKQSVKDTLLDENACCWNDPYRDEIKDSDVNVDNLTLDVNNKLREKALQLIADRREYMHKKAIKAQNSGKHKSCIII